jgi:hypothetical protein
MVKGFNKIARRELVECCEPIWHRDLVSQIDCIDRALDTIELTRREISIALDNKTSLANILKAIGLFQTIDRHITLESVKTFLVVEMKENLSSNEHTRMAGTGSAQMSHRIGVLGELRSNLQPGNGLIDSCG